MSYTTATVWTERSSLQDFKVWRCLRGFKNLTLWRAFSPCLRVLAQGCFNKQIKSYKNETFLFAAVLSSALLSLVRSSMQELSFEGKVALKPEARAEAEAISGEL